MKTKRLLAAVLVLVFAFCACTVVLASSPRPSTATVTIISKGEFVLKNYEVVVSSDDFNIDDALKAAHDAKYEGGSDKGYASATGDYGLYITKLWGDTSGAFGYTVNNKMSSGLSDKVSAGDSVVAYIYSDATAYSDKYTYFDKNSVTVKANEEVTLTLSGLGYDENWQTVVSPLADATITVDGEKTEYKTDSNGKVTISLKGGKTYTVSASADTLIVPPICLVTVEKSGSAVVWIVAGAVLIVIGVGMLVATKKKKQ